MTRAKMSLGACSFCEQPAQIIVAFGPDKSVCIKCVHDISQLMGNSPMGSVTCDKCGDYHSFSAVTKYGASLLFELKEVADPVTDENAENPNNICRYTVVGSNQTWKPKSYPDKFRCGNTACGGLISPWKVYANKYVAEVLPKQRVKKPIVLDS